jgi:hypothetical protein
MAAAIGVLVAGLTLGGGEDDPDDAAAEARDDEDSGQDGPSRTAPRRTTTTRPTTPTTMAPLGPVFGEPIEGALLLHRSGRSWTRLDLTTGALEPMTLPDIDLFNAEAMPGGLVVAAGEEVRYYPVLGDDLEPEGALVGRGNQVVRAGADRLWLLDQPGSADEPTTRAQLVDLRGQVLRELEVPGYQVFTTADEVVVGRGGRVYVVEESGYRPIATGYPNGVIGEAALVTTCDDAGACALQLQPTDGSPPRLVTPIENPDTPYLTLVSGGADGQAAVVVHDSTGAAARLFLFDADRTRADQVELSVGVQGGSPRWLPGDRGLLLSTSAGLQWVRPRDGTWGVEDVDIPVLGFPEVFFFVTP